MRAIDADKLKKCVLKWLPQDPCGKQEKEMPFETDICVSMLMEIDEQPTIQLEPHWHPVSKQPQEDDDYLLLTHEKFKYGTFKRIIIGAWNNATKEWLEEYGDMYRTVNHPVAWMSKDELLLLKGYEVTE